jgi:hypothetical protein
MDFNFLAFNPEKVPPKINLHRMSCINQIKGLELIIKKKCG